jgi:hypothetical protein
VTIHPATDTVPENMLRWYLEFSAPMHRGDALNHLTLLDEKGRQVEGAFLDLSEELWDPSGTRLTVLFDPGRVKRGIRTNLESGRPLVAGHRYALRIDGGWRDRRARPLGAPTEKRFFATTADYRGPDPDGWSLRVPEIGTRDPLEIGFGEPLDHALATRLIAVIDGRGRPVEGEVSLDEAGTRWRLSPVNPWFGERYQIAVSAELEDLAGNRPGRAFDQDVAAEQRPDSDGGQRFRSFFPVRGKRRS